MCCWASASTNDKCALALHRDSSKQGLPLVLSAQDSLYVHDHGYVGGTKAHLTGQFRGHRTAVVWHVCKALPKGPVNLYCVAWRPGVAAPGQLLPWDEVVKLSLSCAWCYLYWRCAVRPTCGTYSVGYMAGGFCLLVVATISFWDVSMLLQLSDS